MTCDNTQKCNVGTYNICIRQNNTYNLRFKREVDGSLFNFSPYSSLFTIRDKPNGKILFQGTRANYITYEEEIDVNCIWRIDIPSNITKNFFFVNGYFDIVIFTDETDVTPILKGYVSVESGMSLVVD